MLKGKTALVTGSTSGIGLGIARSLAQAGCNLVINGLGNAEEIETIRSELAQSSGVEVLFDGANMMEPEQISHMVERTNQHFGGIDVLVNNAGIQYVSPVEEFPIEKWDAIIAINLSSSFHTIRAAIPSMKKRGFGRIINLASAHALVASPYKSAYVAAKHGLAGLTKTVALEVAENGITVNAVCPGYVLTPLVEKQIPDTAHARGISEEEVVRDVLLAAQSTKQFVTVEQISGLVIFLCSQSAASITGALLPIDGGWTAH
ncbi:MAG: 3-hydroxybutyrate dehydrogenase [marine bacterium B5-7]|nr:MAG: 3-hydroxybutyrate dehydrogenase [marine bacterium B5-7]